MVQTLNFREENKGRKTGNFLQKIIIGGSWKSDDRMDHHMWHGALVLIIHLTRKHASSMTWTKGDIKNHSNKVGIDGASLSQVSTDVIRPPFLEVKISKQKFGNSKLETTKSSIQHCQLQISIEVQPIVLNHPSSTNHKTTSHRKFNTFHSARYK